MKLGMKLKRAKLKNSGLLLLSGLLMSLLFQNCSKIAVRDPETQNGTAGSSAVASEPATAAAPVASPAAAPATLPAGGSLPPGPASPGEPTCVSQLIDTHRQVRVLFLVDTSGSNVGQDGGLATDSNKTWRSNVLKSTLAKYGGKNNFRFGLLTFNGTSAKAQIKINNEAVFSNDKDLINNGIKNFLATSDEGYTPYRAALLMAKRMIANDMKMNPSAQTSYSVVMVSDGKATDYNDDPNNVIPDADAIVSMAPQQIVLNSVFYHREGKVDLAQTKYLETIAKIGQGAFVAASSTTVLNIDDVLRVSQVICQ